MNLNMMRQKAKNKYPINLIVGVAILATLCSILNVNEFCYYKNKYFLQVLAIDIKV